MTVPLLGLASPGAMPWFQGTLPNVAADVRKLIEVKKSLHWLHEEDPELIVSSFTDFFG